MRYLFLLCLLLFTAAEAAAQVRARASVDSTTAVVGSQLTLHLEVGVPTGGQVLPFDLEALSNEQVEFLGESPWDTLRQGDNLRLQKDFQLLVWDSGAVRIPALPVEVQADGQTLTATTNDIPLQVSLLPGGDDIADIKPIIEEARRWQDFLPLMLVLLAVLVVVTAVVLLVFLQKKKKAPPAPPPPPPLPHQTALEKLARLRSERKWEKGAVKAYHSELTHIVREYIEGRYEVQALEKTTAEILRQMRFHGLPKDLQEKMTALLQTADLVKFAKAEPPAEYHERALDLAVEFIEETRPVEPAASSEQ